MSKKDYYETTWGGGGSTNASDLTSGTVALARGGTGADLSATGGTSQYVKQATLGGAMTVGAIAAGDLPTAIDAAKIADGTVSNTEFQYLNGVTSAIQTQLTGKLATPSMTTNRYGLWNGTTFVDGTLINNAGVVELASASWINLGYAGAPASTGYGLGAESGAVRLQAFSGGAIRSYAGTTCVTNVSSTGLAVGLSTTASSAMIHARSTSTQLLLDYSSGVNASFTVDAIGNLSISYSGTRLGIGPSASVSGNYGLAIMQQATAGELGIAIGLQASSGAYGVAIGYSTGAINGGVAIGREADVTATEGIALGAATVVSGGYGLAIGREATSTASCGIALGLQAVCNVANSMVIGASANPVNTIWAGKGSTNATPTSWSIRGTGGSGTNIAGGDICIDAGPGTGNAATGTGRLRVTSAGSSGTTLQSTWVDRIAWNQTGIGFFGTAPAARPAAIADATDAASAITQLNLALAALRTLGLIAT